jgi:hypothetical protein
MCEDWVGVRVGWDEEAVEVWLFTSHVPFYYELLRCSLNQNIPKILRIVNEAQRELHAVLHLKILQIALFSP